MAEAATPERKMKRSLTAFDLTCLGIGAIIGSGIFALTGTAAAGERAAADLLHTPVINFIQAWISNSPLDMGRAGAGPAVGRAAAEWADTPDQARVATRPQASWPRLDVLGRPP